MLLEIAAKTEDDVENLKRFAMGLAAIDVSALSQARATLSELADQVKAGAEKSITKNGESHVALIDARRLDYC